MSPACNLEQNTNNLFADVKSWSLQYNWYKTCSKLQEKCQGYSCYFSLASEPNFTINSSEYRVPIEIAEICALLDHEAKSTAGELQFLPSVQIKRLIHKEADLQTSKRKITSA